VGSTKDFIVRTENHLAGGPTVKGQIPLEKIPPFDKDLLAIMFRKSSDVLKFSW